MVSKKLIYLAFIFLGLANQVFGQVQSLKGRELYIPGEILVRLKSGASPESRSKALTSLGESKVLSNPDFFKVKLKGNLDVLQAVDQMKKDPSVQYAQPNYRYYAMAACPAPTDNFYFLPYNWPFLKIQADKAWTLLNWPNCPPGSSSVTVGVIDSGVSRRHPDLGNVFLIGYNALTNTPDSAGVTASDDDYGHGTYVTAIIAAQWNLNNPESCGPSATTGMAGLAPGVNIMAVKALDNTGSGTTASIVAGTDFAVAHGAQVLNFSLGSPGSEGLDPAEQQSLDNALANNCVVVAAAGNESGPLDFPAAYPPVIAVGATDPNDQVSFYSNGGPGLDLMAPGGLGHTTLTYAPDTDVFSAILECPTAAVPEFARMSPGPGSDFNFGTAAGTSAAAPFVTGAAALILSMYPTLTNAQVAQRLIDNADSLNGNKGWDAATGYGRLNVYRALLPVASQTPDVTHYLTTFNSPNPFYPDVDTTTNITLAITQAQPVELTIFDTSGEVALRKNYAATDLNNNPSNPQFKSFYIPWDGRNGNGQEVKTGIYFYRVKIGTQTGQNKIAVIQGSK